MILEDISFAQIHIQSPKSIEDNQYMFPLFYSNQGTNAIIFEKLEHLHKDVEQNTKEIVQIKQQIAFGRGGVRVLVWVIGIVATVATTWNFLSKNGS